MQQRFGDRADDGQLSLAANRSGVWFDDLSVTDAWVLHGAGSVREGEPYTLHVEAADITQADALKIQWGNGSVQMVPATQSTVSHTYTDGYSAHEISAWRAVHTRARGLPLRGTAPMGSSIPGSD